MSRAPGSSKEIGHFTFDRIGFYNSVGRTEVLAKRTLSDGDISSPLPENVVRRIMSPLILRVW